MSGPDFNVFLHLPTPVPQYGHWTKTHNMRSIGASLRVKCTVLYALTTRPKGYLTSYRRDLLDDLKIFSCTNLPTQFIDFIVKLIDLVAENKCTKLRNVISCIFLELKYLFKFSSLN